jgi:hypothetical protein
MRTFRVRVVVPVALGRLVSFERNRSSEPTATALNAKVGRVRVEHREEMVRVQRVFHAVLSHGYPSLAASAVRAASAIVWANFPVSTMGSSRVLNSPHQYSWPMRGLMLLTCPVGSK